MDITQILITLNLYHALFLINSEKPQLFMFTSQQLLRHDYQWNTWQKVVPPVRSTHRTETWSPDSHFPFH